MSKSRASFLVGAGRAGVVAGAVGILGCWHVWWGERDATCRDGIRFFSTTYRGAASSTTAASDAELAFSRHCTESFPLAGFAPCDDRPHPLVVFVPGTDMAYDHPLAIRLLQEIARQGYVAVSFDYANLWPAQGCPRYRSRAYCMFAADQSESAVRRTCDTVPGADCRRGVAVLGHSQGAMLSVLSGNYDPDVRWVHAMGVSAEGPPGLLDLSCILPAERRLPKERLFVACGDCDIFFSGAPKGDCAERRPGVRAGLEALTDMHCDTPWACAAARADTGAPYGFVEIPSHGLDDGEADHCYMFADGCLGPIDPNWLRDDQRPWTLPSILRFLRAALPPNPQ